MRDETPAETLVINSVWKMTRHTVCRGCGRYRQTNTGRICRKCARQLLEIAAQQAAEAPPDDLSYYDNPPTHTGAHT